MSGSRHVSISIRRKVEWVDTDASGHWHNTAVIRFAEMAESALLRSVGLEDLVYANGAPRAQMSASFLKSARFGEEIDIECTVADVGRSKVVFESTISKGRGVLARVSVVAVFVDTDGAPQSWPEDVRRVLLGTDAQAESS